MPIRRADIESFSGLGRVNTDGLEPGALSANDVGRAKMASGFFTRFHLDKFDFNCFPAIREARSKFGDGFVNARLLADFILSADVPGRRKMAEGYFDASSLDKFAINCFTANAEGRSKFALEFVSTELLAENALAASTLGRTKVATDFFDKTTFADKVTDAAIGAAKLCLVGETYDFSTATALRAKDPVDPTDVVTLQYLEANGGGGTTIGGGWLDYKVIDPVADAVPGMTNTYYIDKGATDYGYNVRVDDQGIPEIYLTINGREKLWAASLGGVPPADFTVVRALSTGPEGFSEVGSLNAVTLDLPLEGDAWIRYRRHSRAVEVGGTPESPLDRTRYRPIDLVADAVPGQANTYYIDKGVTTHGYNVRVVSGVPDITVVRNGLERLWVPEVDLGHPTNAGDFSAVRSLSTGGEGPAAVGSVNAIQFDVEPTGDVWIHYTRDGLASA